MTSPNHTQDPDDARKAMHRASTAAHSARVTMDATGTPEARDRFRAAVDAMNAARAAVATAAVSGLEESHRLHPGVRGTR